MKTLKKSRRAVLRGSRKSRVRPARAAFRSRNGSRHAAAGRRNGASTRDPERLRVDAKLHAAIKNFEIGSRAFAKQNFGRARDIFEKLAQSDIQEVAERARFRLQLCHQRLSRPAPSPKTAEEHYTLGVAALNAHQTAEAIAHLAKASKPKPDREHIRYALAAAYALQGNADAALEHLKMAITLRPANRIQARHDEDFSSLASDPRFRELVYPEVP